MDIKEEEEIKKEFQLERVILFTDAVFAIILTIMVLDVKLPEGIRHATEEHLRDAFQELIFKFSAYCLTFFLVARFWIGHLKMFRYLKDYDSNLLMLNLAFLFSVTLFPFAVSLVSGNIKPGLTEFNWGWTIYILIVYSTIFIQSFITWYLLKNRETLCTNGDLLEAVYNWKVTRTNLYLIPILILTVFIFNYFLLPYTFSMYTIIAYGVINGRLRKKYYPNENKGPIIARAYRYIKSKRSRKQAEIHNL